MKRRIVSAIALFLLLVPAITQAAVNIQEDFTPGTAAITYDFALKGKLKTFLEPYIQEELKRTTSEKTKIMINQLLAGKRFFLSVEGSESAAVSFSISDEQWRSLIEGAEKENYGSTDVYVDELLDSYAAKLGDYAVIASLVSKEAIHKAIDLATGSSTDSLSSSQKYGNMINSYLNPRLLSFTINFNQLKKMLEESGLDSQLSYAGFLDLFEFEGFSLAEKENGTGYKFNLKITGDPAEFSAQGFSFNPSGEFTPSLYKKLPNAKPIFYSESFDQKTSFEQSKKLIEKMAPGLLAEYLEGIKEEIGLDIESILNTFNQELAFAVQYDEASPLPYVSIIGNVSNNREAGIKLAADTADAITNLLKTAKSPKGTYSINKTGDVTIFKFDLKKISPDLSSLPFSSVTLSVGVTDDNLFVISNYPGIEKAENRIGFVSDSDFSAYSEAKERSSGITYLNMRNLWKALDNIFLLAQTKGEATELDSMQGYYAVLDKIYGWKDLFIVSHATNDDATVTGTITTDDAKHQTYKGYISKLKASDQDKNGYSDYDELYVYHTPINNTGVDDVGNLKKGLDVNGTSKIFKDVPQDNPYIKEVSVLKKQGLVGGYPDGTFKPEKNITRAEFTAMVVKAFEIGDGILPTAKGPYPIFNDVHYNAWYYDAIMKASEAGLVKGAKDSSGVGYIFLPEQNITRAEALTILNNASSALQDSKAKMKACNPALFKDVPKEEWYCKPIMNAYSSGVFPGKTPTAFKPFDLINRGEAAGMIERALEKDLAKASKPGSLNNTLLPSGSLESILP